MKNTLLLILMLFAFLGCEEQNDLADAYGNFEARELIVSAEANGKILQLDIQEGQQLQANQLVGFLDTTQLHLKKQQLLASIRTISGKQQDVEPQIEVYNSSKENLLREKNRIEALLKDKAATPKQLDDINSQIEVIDQQIEAARAQNKTFNRGLLGETDPIRIQIAQIEDQIKKSYIINPIKGTVLLKLAENSEFVNMGKPLYKIADLSEMELRIFVSGAQLHNMKLGQEVAVFIDEDEESNRQLSGTISWISDKAEFTPKIVQTKEERVNLVYAVKVSVENDGSLKIGMPGEVRF